MRVQERVDCCRDLAQGLVQNIDYSFAVAGAPSTHVATLLSRHDSQRFEWAISEKSAVEAAVGLSCSGQRSCVVLKHNGLAVALDSLTNAAVHSIGAAMILVSGDDPAAVASTCVQDSRRLAEAAGLPVLEPTLLQDTELMVAKAVELSEESQIPVLVRITGAMHEQCHVCTPLPFDPTIRAPRHWPAPILDLDVAHNLTKFGRYQRRGLVVQPRVAAYIDQAGLTVERCGERCTTAIVAVGSTAVKMRQVHNCVLALQATLPIPAALVEWANAHERILILEEPDPITEEWLGQRMTDPSRLRGRLTGHLPLQGAVDLAEVTRVIETDEIGSWTQVERKPEGIPPLSPYDEVFRMIADLRCDGCFVATDVGSSVRLCYPPYSAADVALSLGSAIAVAAGAARTGKRSIAVIGDFAMLHSGLNSLISAVEHQLPLLVVVLANGKQEKTGGQPVPDVDFAALVRACGISQTITWHLGESTNQGTGRVRELIDGPLPAVVFVRCDMSNDMTET